MKYYNKLCRYVDNCLRNPLPDYRHSSRLSNYSLNHSQTWLHFSYSGQFFDEYSFVLESLITHNSQLFILDFGIHLDDFTSPPPFVSSTFYLNLASASTLVRRHTVRVAALTSSLYIHVCVTAYSYATEATTWTDIEKENQATALKHCLDIAY